MKAIFVGLLVFSAADARAANPRATRRLERQLRRELHSGLSHFVHDGELMDRVRAGVERGEKPTLLERWQLRKVERHWKSLYAQALAHGESVATHTNKPGEIRELLGNPMTPPDKQKLIEASREPMRARYIREIEEEAATVERVAAEGDIAYAHLAAGAASTIANLIARAREGHFELPAATLKRTAELQRLFPLVYQLNRLRLDDSVGQHAADLSAGALEPEEEPPAAELAHNEHLLRVWALDDLEPHLLAGVTSEEIREAAGCVG
jgi:hypothetical protein